jgi:hypothetical protein
VKALDELRTVGAERHQIGECLSRLAGDEGLYRELRIPAPVDVDVDDVGGTRRPAASALTAVSLERTGFERRLRGLGGARIGLRLAGLRLCLARLILGVLLTVALVGCDTASFVLVTAELARCGVGVGVGIRTARRWIGHSDSVCREGELCRASDTFDVIEVLDVDVEVVVIRADRRAVVRDETAGRRRQYWVGSEASKRFTRTEIWVG